MCLHITSEILAYFFLLSIKENVLGTTFLFFHKPGVGYVSSALSVREIINATSNKKECGVHLRIVRKK